MLKQNDAAKADLDKALELSPGYIEANYFLGVLNEQHGQEAGSNHRLSRVAQYQRDDQRGQAGPEMVARPSGRTRAAEAPRARHARCCLSSVGSKALPAPASDARSSRVDRPVAVSRPVRFFANPKTGVSRRHPPRRATRGHGCCRDEIRRHFGRQCRAHQERRAPRQARGRCRQQGRGRRFGDVGGDQSACHLGARRPRCCTMRASTTPSLPPANR